MNDVSGFARGMVVWLIPLAVVAAALGFETDWGRAVVHPPPAPGKAAPQPVAVALLPEYQIDGGVDARKETVDRVLFNPTRRPAPPASEAAGSQSSMQRGLYTLTGTTVVGNVATAFLREVHGGKSRSVRKGETINGMVVTEVKEDHVRLKQGDDFEDLPLKIATGPKTTIQAVVAPTAPGQANARGGSGAGANAAAANAANASQGRARPVTAAPAAAAGQPRAAGPTSVSELLAERRRAARAAAEAAGSQPAQQSMRRNPQ
jgi:hypothetical protein